jgi:hypothetical protein
VHTEPIVSTPSRLELNKSVRGFEFGLVGASNIKEMWDKKACAFAQLLAGGYNLSQRRRCWRLNFCGLGSIEPKLVANVPGDYSGLPQLTPLVAIKWNNSIMKL